MAGIAKEYREESVEGDKRHLKPVFHMIVRIIPVVSKNVQTIGTIIWKRYSNDRKRRGSLQNLHDRLDRPDRT